MGELVVHSNRKLSFPAVELGSSNLVIKCFFGVYLLLTYLSFKVSQEHNILQNATKRREITKMKNDVESRNWALNC